MSTTPTVWQSEQQANTSDIGATSSDQYDPKIVALSNGNFVVLWTDNSDVGVGSDDDTDIIGQMYDVLGNQMGGEFKANAGYFVDDEGFFDVAALDNGRFALVYEDTDGAGTSIRAEIWSTDGSGVTTAVTRDIRTDINTDVLSAPSVAGNSDGSFLVSYQRTTTTGNQFSETNLVSAAGTVGATMDSLTSSAVTSTDVTSALLTNGDYVVISTYQSPSSGEIALFHNIIDGTTGTPGAPLFVADTGTNSRTDDQPSVAALTGGGFVVAWHTVTDAFDDDIRYAIYDNSGIQVGGTRTLHVGGSRDHSHPVVIARDDGGATIIYDDDGGTGAIRGHNIDSAGNPLNSFTTFADETGNSGVSLPAGALLADGRLAVAWEENDSAEADVHFGIWDTRDAVINGDGDDNIITSGTTDTTINGGAGADTLYGHAAVDTLNGGAGEDSLIGFGGDDILNGGADDDYLDGGFGFDALDGGDGIDTASYAFYGGATEVNLLNGEVTFPPFAEIETIQNVENITLGSGTGLITPDGEANSLDGGGGIDEVDYSDSLSGIIISTQSGGGSGGNAQGDRLFNIEIVRGTDFADRITGSNGVANTLIGQGDNDTFQSSTGGNDYQGNSGTDTIDYRASGTVVFFSLVSGGFFGEANGDSYTSIEDARGSVHADDITGTTGRNTLHGEGGDDFLYGGDHNDSLFGDAGIDELYGEAGQDRIFGGDDNDRLFGGNEVGVGDNIRGGDGDDEIHGGDGEDRLTGDAGADTIYGDADDDRIWGSDGNDTLFGGDDETGIGSGVDILNGQGDDDVIYAGDGNDVVNGGAGADEIYGGDDDDKLYGQAGIDTIFGDDGDDLLRGHEDGDSLSGGNGVDVVDGDGGDDFLYGDAGNDRLIGDDGADEIHGGDDDDKAWGGAGNDIIRGDAGNDLLYGRGDDDTLVGGSGNDTLQGDAGNDGLFGGADDDRLFGGAGTDTFTFENNFGNDIIFDFEFAQSEHIALFAVTNITDFADLSANHLTYAGGDAIITDGANTITVRNIAPGAFDAGDFFF